MEFDSYCGVDCHSCIDYLSKKCPDCKRSSWTLENICFIVQCCIDKKVEYCGDCKEFPCDEMKEFYSENESHTKAYQCMCQRVRK